jgi:predicted ArsR family transcriptional regulator
MRTDYQADHQPTITTGLSIAEAADRLGISENAVRQRIKRGTLPAAKGDGVWSITLVDYDTDHQPTTGRDHEAGYQGRPPDDYEATSSSSVVSAAARAQLAAIRDEFVQPLVDQIAAQAEQIGRLSAERDALQADLERRDQETSPAPPVSAQVSPTPAAPGGWRARLAAWLRG